MNLSDIFDKYKDAEFEYGVLDCCLFAGNVVRDYTGTDYVKPWRGKYHSEFGALRKIAEYGGFIGIVTAAFGDMKAMDMAKDGDPVLIKPPFVERDHVGAGLGICDGESIVYLTEKGLTKVSILFGQGCWNV